MSKRPTLVLATHNQDKVAEMRAALKQVVNVEAITDYDPGFNPIEDQPTLAGNAMIKALAAWKLCGHMVVADDTGLFVDALGGAPGVFSARYAKEGATYSENCQKLLTELAGVEDEQRSAQFVCHMTLLRPSSGEPQRFDVSRKLLGKITQKVAGADGFGYDPVFAVAEDAPGLEGKTLAELTTSEKNSISHRGRALVALIEVLNGFDVGA